MLEILIRLDGKDHGLRYWPTVPRVGDTVEVKIEGELKTATVQQVIWRTQTEIEFRDGHGRATLICVTDIG